MTYEKKNTPPTCRQEEKYLFGLINKEQGTLPKTSHSDEFISVLLKLYLMWISITECCCCVLWGRRNNKI